MENLSPKWTEYLRLQKTSRGMNRIDDSYWGFEAKLDALLRNSSNDVPEQLSVVCQSASRRERFRTCLLLERADELCPIEGSPIAMLEARETLRFIHATVSPQNRKLLFAVGMGFSTKEVATDVGISSGAVRTRLQRLRVQLRQAA